MKKLAIAALFAATSLTAGASIAQDAAKQDLTPAQQTENRLILETARNLVSYGEAKSDALALGNGDRMATLSTALLDWNADGAHDAVVGRLRDLVAAKCPGLDATGEDVFTVDSNGDRPDDQVEAIAQWIVCAVNTCGGYRAEFRQ